MQTCNICVQYVRSVRCACAHGCFLYRVNELNRPLWAEQVASESLPCFQGTSCAHLYKLRAVCASKGRSRGRQAAGNGGVHGERRSGQQRQSGGKAVVEPMESEGPDIEQVKQQGKVRGSKQATSVCKQTFRGWESFRVHVSSVTEQG